MRLVIASKKHIGKKLAYPIRTYTGLLFLPAGKELTDSIITKIKHLGITYIYIEETFSDEVVMEPVFEDIVKLDLLTDLINMYTQIKKTKVINDRLLLQIINMIIDESNINENSVLYRNPTKEQIDEIAAHSLEVAIYCIAICRNRRTKYQDIEKIVASAILHDIGKLILDSKPPLERALNMMRANTTISPLVYVPVLHIHEKIDGSGPYKIKGDKLHLHAQILHIANNYSNLVQQVLDINQRIEVFNMEASTRYNFEIFKKAAEVLYCYPNGLMIELTNSVTGIVAKQNIGFPLRPIIITKTGTVIDLMKEPTLFIKEIID
ncbi:hypothetical protein AN641_02835 [Candidatus Epulonipiscioides gigas]|nr:hypothetical protein AN641_02835 [Epulopiscium sp. SCG-C07WGA-EpuloA2]